MVTYNVMTTSGHSIYVDTLAEVRELVGKYDVKWVDEGYDAGNGLVRNFHAMRTLDPAEYRELRPSDVAPDRVNDSADW